MSINRTCAIATCGAGSEGMLGSLTRSGESDERRSASEHPPECISGARFKDGTPVTGYPGWLTIWSVMIFFRLHTGISKHRSLGSVLLQRQSAGVHEMIIRIG